MSVMSSSGFARSAASLEVMILDVSKSDSVLESDLLLNLFDLRLEDCPEGRHVGDEDVSGEGLLLLVFFDFGVDSSSYISLSAAP
jgi:hypothetical protein